MMIYKKITASALIFCMMSGIYQPAEIYASVSQTSSEARLEIKPEFDADIERGTPLPPLDLLASVLASPIKLLLWNRHYATHKISPETEAVIEDFIVRNNLKKVKVRVNQWAPFQEVGRVITNREVGILYRIFAIPTTFFTSATSRLLAGLVFSDYYDPFSNTIHIFSNDPSIALHEGGHAKDFEKQRWKGTYGLIRMVPGVNLAQEMIATQEAFDYLEFHGTDDEKIRAPAVLYPAFFTYVGGYMQFVPLGWLGALLGGHFYGRIRSRYKKEELESLNYSKKKPVRVHGETL